MNNKVIAIAILAVQLGACVPMLSRGEYVLFDKTPDIEILETGIPEKRNFSPIRPTLYKLSDELFEIEIRPGNNGKEATFSTRSSSGKLLRLELMGLSSSETKQACLFVDHEFKKPYSQYLKLQFWVEGCEIYTVGTHSFDVAIVDDDEILGIKKIVFELKQGGYYVWYDSI